MFKIDTKEKFHVITLDEPSLTANMTAELSECLVSFLENDVKNVILKMQAVEQIDVVAGEALVKLQQNHYENKSSFVICCLQESVENFLDENDLLELMNYTPTESEAWDILQMEEIERELLDGF